MKNYWKAGAGFLAAALVAYIAASDGGMTSQDWLTVLIAGLGGGFGVYAAPKNKPKR